VPTPDLDQDLDVDQDHRYRGAAHMQRPSWVKTFSWAMIGGIIAPAAVVSVLINRVARRRFFRILGIVRDEAAEIRDDLFGEYTLEEFLTGAVARRPRR
jgi:hypothetical protein